MQKALQMKDEGCSKVWHDMAAIYHQFYAMVFGLYPESGRESWKH